MKKGFTLVELLAVIAILAILVIIALPNVMGLFNDAKEQSFQTETKEILKVVEQQWMSDSLFSTGAKTYAKCNGCTGKQLDLTGRDNLEYYVVVDKGGNVDEFYVTDGTYQYSYVRPAGETKGLKPEGIKDVKKIAEIDNQEVFAITPSGVETGNVVVLFVTDENPARNDGNFFVGSNVSGVNSRNYIFDNYYDAINTPARNGSNINFFIKVKSNNSVISETSLGFMYEGNVYYMEVPNGTTTDFTAKREALARILPETACRLNAATSGGHGSPIVTNRSYFCNVEDRSGNSTVYSIHESGSISISNGDWECILSSDLAKCVISE